MDIELIVKILSWMWISAICLSFGVAFIDIVISSNPDRDQNGANKRMRFAAKSFIFGILMKAAQLVA